MPSSSESAPARTLRDLLRREARLDPRLAARLLADVAIALRPLHGRGAAHGAVTPEHVRLVDGTRATLAARAPDAPGAPPPWPTYLAPEQIHGGAARPASDVYALGLVGWEMLAGRQPWAGESLYGVVVKQREQDLPRLSTLRPGLPRALVVAIEGALHKHPADRWRSTEELLAALAPALDTVPPPVAAAAGAASAVGRPSEPRPVAAVVPPGDRYRAAIDGPGRLTPPAGGAAPPPRPTAATRAVPAVAVPPGGAATVAGGSPRPDPAAPPPSLAAPARRRRRVPGLVALLALVGLGGLAGMAVVQGRHESAETRAWLDSVGIDAGEVVLDSAGSRQRAALAVSRARRDSLARRAALRQQLTERARRDSLARAALATDSAAAVDAEPPDSAAPPDSLVPPPTADVVRR